MRFVFGLLVLLMASLGTGPRLLAPRAITVGAVEDLIRPRFHASQWLRESLSSDVGALCAAPSDEALTTAQRTVSRNGTGACSRIEFCGFGPLVRRNRMERLLFWPDRKGIALRQVQAMLAAKDETATDPATLQARPLRAGPGGARVCDVRHRRRTLATGTGTSLPLCVRRSRHCCAAPAEMSASGRTRQDLGATDPAARVRPRLSQQYRGAAGTRRGDGARARDDPRPAHPAVPRARRGRAEAELGAVLARSTRRCRRSWPTSSGCGRCWSIGASGEYAPTEQFWIGEQAIAEFDSGRDGRRSG